MTAKKKIVEKSSDKTLRDEFAARALEGLVAIHLGSDANHCGHVAKMAFAYADAMLEARDAEELQEESKESPKEAKDTAKVHTAHK